MAPLPPESTARLFVDYITASANGVEHTVMVRYASADRTANDAQVRLASVLNAIGASAFSNGWKVLKVYTALAGERFTTLQTPIAALSTFTGNGGGTGRVNQPIQTAFQGKGVASPRRVSLSLFGIIAGGVPDRFRWVVGSGAPAWVGAGVNALNASASPLRAIDGTDIVWYSYVNVQYNSYWERRIRIN